MKTVPLSKADADFMDRVCRSYASIVEAQRVHLDNVERLTRLVRRGDWRLAKIFAIELEAVAVEDRQVLETMDQQCVGWRQWIAEAVSLNEALMAAGVAFDEKEAVH